MNNVSMDDYNVAMRQYAPQIEIIRKLDKAIKGVDVTTIEHCLNTLTDDQVNLGNVPDSGDLIITTILYRSVYSRDMDYSLGFPYRIVKQLNLLGCNINFLYCDKRFPGGITPLMLAATGMGNVLNVRFVEFLIDLGADIFQENDHGFNVIDLVARDLFRTKGTVSGTGSTEDAAYQRYQKLEKIYAILQREVDLIVKKRKLKEKLGIIK